MTFGGYNGGMALETLEYLNETKGAWVTKPFRGRYGQDMVLLPCP